MQNIYYDKQLILLQEGSNRILSKDQILVSCSHMNCCLQNYTTHQFTYFIYYLFQDKFKYLKIIKIQQVHQEIHANRILSKVQKSFWSCTHVNSFQNYTLYINLHILFNLFSKTTSNIQESRKSIKRLKR